MTNRKQFSLLALIMFSIILSATTFAAQDFIIENRTSPLFIVNGTTGNIIMAPVFGLSVSSITSFLKEVKNAY